MFEGKTILVAGASSGINLAIARSFAASGAKLAIISRSEERIEAARGVVAAEGGAVLAFAADVRNYDDIAAACQATAEAFGGIDIVISGAAGNFLADAASLSANGFRTVIDIDLIGTFHVFRAALPFLNTPGASLVAISAPQGARATAQQVHACAAKAGINMMVKVLALEWGEKGIRVNAISPGPIDGTEGTSRLWPSDEAVARLVEDIPMRSLGSTDDIAAAAAYLASDAARYVTGVILDVDGGYILGPAKLGEAQ